jgi:hypothetical protein
MICLFDILLYSYILIIIIYILDRTRIYIQQKQQKRIYSTFVLVVIITIFYSCLSNLFEYIFKL